MKIKKENLNSLLIIIGIVMLVIVFIFIGLPATIPKVDVEKNDSIAKSWEEQYLNEYLPTNAKNVQDKGNNWYTFDLDSNTFIMYMFEEESLTQIK